MRTPAPNPPILLAAGGTGGHVFPAEALAAELEARGRRLVLMTDRRGAAFGDVLGRIERHAITARSPSVRGPLARGIAVLGLVRGVIQSAFVLRRIRPAAAVGFGGYPSVPPMVASGRLGIPSVLHEQNAVLGRANRMLAPPCIGDSDVLPRDRGDSPQPYRPRHSSGQPGARCHRGAARCRLRAAPAGRAIPAACHGREPGCARFCRGRAGGHRGAAAGLCASGSR